MAFGKLNNFEQPLANEGHMPIEPHIIDKRENMHFKNNNNNLEQQTNMNQNPPPHLAPLAESEVVVAPKGNKGSKEARQIIEKHDNFRIYDQINSNGAQAKGLFIDTKKLGAHEKELYDQGWSKYAFNEYASTLIPLNRTIPDIRLPG